MASTFPANLPAFPVRRGDSRTFEVEYHDAPPDWAPNTAYVAGTVASETYLADSTVTYGGLSYTCTTAHTSGSAFEASYWTKDAKALGPAYDLSALGSVVTAQARLLPDAEVLIELDTSATDLASGLVAVSIAPADWQTIGAMFPGPLALGFDVQVADAGPAPARVTTILASQLAVDPDYTHAAYGAP